MIESPGLPFCRLPARQGCPCKAGRVPIDETNYSPPAPIEQPAQAPSSNARDVQMPNSVRKAKATVKTAKGTESAPPKGVVAYQGEPGANSHLACIEAYPDLEPLACPTFEDTLAAVRSGGALYAMIPIENSVAGRVADIHHLLPKADLYIVREHFLRVRHQLMALPGASLKTVKRGSAIPRLSASAAILFASST